MIETERLLLRKPRLEDAADLAVAYADPEVVRFIGDGSTATLAEVEEGIDRLLAREHGGSGYATEAALALRDWALAERGLTRLISLIRHENVPSVRVAERIGEHYERDVLARGRPSQLYAVET